MENILTKAAVDTDFINHLVESRTTGKISDYLIKALEDLKLSAIIHPLIYKYEIDKSKSEIIELFEKKAINKIEFEDIFFNTGAKEYYVFLFKELLFEVLGDSIISTYTENEILNKWKYKSNYGEVHTISMSLIIGCAIFLSDDGDSKYLKKIIEDKGFGKIEVYNRKEFFDKHTQEAEIAIPRKERNKMTHVR